MRDWIDLVKKMLTETDLFGNPSDDEKNNVVKFPQTKKPTNNIAVARGGADIHKIPPNIDNLDSFTRGYISAALWSSFDDNEEPLDSNYDIGDIHVNTLEAMIEDCKKFQIESRKLLYLATKKDPSYDESSAGHDFWLSRNGHGAGFFDRNLGTVGEKLHDLAKKYREHDLFAEDGVIY